MKISKLLCFTLSLLIVLFSGCGGEYESDNDDLECTPPNVVGHCNSKSYYVVIADENLTEEHKLAILKSLSEWAEKTNNTLKYQLSFVDMSQNPPDYTPHTIKIYVRDPGPGYLGWTSWSASDYSAYVFVRPSIDGETFRQVMLHEFGHAFNLSFDGDIHYKGPYASIMNPAVGQSTTHLCCPEIRAFCDQFGCQVDCSYQQPGTLKPANINWLETNK